MSTSSPERRSVFQRMPVEAFVTETAPDAEGGELSRSIGLFQLTMFGVGATIGTAPGPRAHGQPSTPRCS